MPGFFPQVDDTNGRGPDSDRDDSPRYYSLHGTPDHRPVQHQLLKSMGRSLDETLGNWRGSGGTPDDSNSPLNSDWTGSQSASQCGRSDGGRCRSSSSSQPNVTDSRGNDSESENCSAANAGNSVYSH